MHIEIRCPNCDKRETPEFPGRYPFRIECQGRYTIKGIIKCNSDQHEMPIEVANGSIAKLDISLPGEQSSRLDSTKVTTDIIEDIKEAEKANYAQCYKSSLTMCRRAIQLALIDRGIEDKPLGQMLKEANAAKILLDDNYIAAKSIKVYGDIGAHRREHFDSKIVNLAIFVAVEMLNEIFKEGESPK